jgi:hypothetical protein
MFSIRRDRDRLVVVAVADECGDRLEAGKLRGSPAALPATSL